MMYSKTGVYGGIHYFPVEAVLTSTHNFCFEQKHENYQIFFYLKSFLVVKFLFFI